MVQAFPKAHNILDSNVIFLTEEGAPAILCSCTKSNVMYIVFNPTSEWACCSCSQANKGYICKHELKVFRMLRPHIEEGSIARLCGLLQVTVHSGVDKIFASNEYYAVLDISTSDS